MEADRQQLTTGPETALKALVSEILGDGPIYLVDLVIRGGKGRAILDVYVESDEVLDVETLATYNRRIGFAIEAEELMPGAYTLNVSSPGADRPLLLLRQYRKHIGRQMGVKYQEDEEAKAISGTLKEVGEEHITLQPGKGDPVTLAFEQITEAKVLLPW